MKILLVCNAGMSTSILVKKMKDIKPDWTIKALSLNEAGSQIDNYEVCLVGPQIKFNIPALKKKQKKIYLLKQFLHNYMA